MRWGRGTSTLLIGESRSIIGAVLSKMWGMGKSYDRLKFSLAKADGEN